MRESIYTPHPAASSGRELDALSAIYRRAIERYQEKNPAADQSARGNSDGTEVKGDSANADIIPR